jgi:hypothetical protein
MVTRDLDVCTSLTDANLETPEPGVSVQTLYLQKDLGALDQLIKAKEALERQRDLILMQCSVSSMKLSISNSRVTIAMPIVISTIIRLGVK